MTKIYIAAIMLIAGGIAFFSMSGKDVTTYTNFADAAQSTQKVKIAGQLAKDKEMIYDPVEDPNHFSFFVRDNNGEERKVILNAAKPQDFELSEQIVITGKMKGDEFHATELLMKCPSKYKDEEIKIKEGKS
ncbi:MAG: cytochrome c maturation protein CcmE [Saprospirales bacterium]|jgi:cytochrome c-type biogenesis protein CcmE|nr:cytochrome c maturation protein CcmE [Saprospirales bacterium]MBK6904662.1 cytochrome c maturation protein CcmE [Saprospirales bacterium]MBK7336297.1 cytochrome c maturation protein CcmE [Saprospirales bacterium]